MVVGTLTESINTHWYLFINKKTIRISRAVANIPVTEGEFANQVTSQGG